MEKRMDELEKRIAALEAKQQEPQFFKQDLILNHNTGMFELVDKPDVVSL